jgi:hypothetical protein
MGTSGSNILDVYESGEAGIIRSAIRLSDGTLGGSLVFHADRQEDGAVRAQLELRFEDLPSLVTIAEVGLGDERYEAGRSWVLVEMEPRQSLSEPLRFSIHIPGKPGSAGENTRNVEAATPIVNAAREAISAVRKGCGDPHGCYYPLCDMDAYGFVGELADDGCIAVVVPLEAQSLHSPDSGT